MKENRRSIIVLFLTLFIVMLGFGMIIPIMPFYIKEFQIAEENSGLILGGIMASYAVMQLIFSPIWGSVSDRMGRKRILALGIFGNGVAMLFMGLATEVWMLFAARIFAGLISSATLPTAMAYISDVTSDEDRGAGMGMMGAAMGAGIVFGPGFGGWLTAGGNLSIPFYAACVFSMLAFIVIVLVLPESLAEDKRDKTGKIAGLDVKAMIGALKSPIGILLVMAFLLSFGMTNFESVFGLVGENKYGYGPTEVANILVMVGLISSLVQGMLTGPLSKKYGEETIIKVTLLLSGIGFIGMAFAQTTLALILATAFFTMSNAMIRPVVSSLTSKRAEMGQGAAMGLNNAFMSLGRVVGPIWAGYIFDLHLDLPYFSGGIVMLIGFVVSVIYIKKEIVDRKSVLTHAD